MFPDTPAKRLEFERLDRNSVLLHNREGLDWLAWPSFVSIQFLGPTEWGFPKLKRMQLEKVRGAQHVVKAPRTLSRQSPPKRTLLHMIKLNERHGSFEVIATEGRRYFRSVRLRKWCRTFRIPAPKFLAICFGRYRPGRLLL